MPGAGSDLGIVGGGVLGMTLALRLRQAGHRVTVIEGAPSPGGLASPQELGGYTWDRFYHVILLSDRHLRGLLAELGLADRIRWKITRTGVYADGELHSLSSTLDFLRFPPLDLLDKARLAATILHASRIRDARPLERIPVADWLRRLSGPRTFERLWLPLLKSKLGENYRQTSAAFIWAYIVRLYAARRSGLKREMFGYVEGGYAPVLRRFREHLEALGVRFRLGEAARAVLGEPERATVTLAGGSRLAFDAAVLTVPCGRILELCPGLAPAERERLARVVYQGIICPSLLLRKPLAGYYLTNITDPEIPFTGVVEMTALVDPAWFGGHTLVYLPRYVTQADPAWGWDDALVRERFLAALETMYRGFRREDVVAFQVARAREVQALATLDYSAQALPPTTTSLGSVFVVNSAQIVNGTLNLNETVALANAKARELETLLAGAQPLRAPSPPVHAAP